LLRSRGSDDVPAAREEPGMCSEPRVSANGSSGTPSRCWQPSSGALSGQKAGPSRLIG